MARLRGGEHRRRRREIGLADLHVDDRAPGSLERAGGRLHFHHMERLDAGDAGRSDERVSIEGTNPCGQEKRYGNALPAALAAVRSNPRCLSPHVSRTTGSCGPRSRRARSSRRSRTPTSTSAPAKAASRSTRKCPVPQGKELRNFQIDPPEITVLPAPSRANAPPTAPKSPRGPRRQTGQRRQVRETGEARAAMPPSASTRTSA